MGFAEDFKAAIQVKEFRESFQKLVENAGINLGRDDSGEGAVTDDELATALEGMLDVDEIAALFSAGGPHGIFAQDINTSYSGSKVALYEGRLISGPLTHPLTGKDMPKQKTVFDDILEALDGEVIEAAEPEKE